MKLKLNVFSYAIILAGLTLIMSCGGGPGGVSPTTNWAYNEPDNGGFEVSFAEEQITGPGLVLIEGGTFIMGRVEQDVTYDWNNIPTRVTIPSFYMDETEIRNVDYREYLYWLTRVYIDYPEVYRKAVPDTLVWLRPLAYNEPFAEYYFRHPAYNDYPVVGVSWLQADAYCSWRTDRVNEDIMISEGILEMDPNQVNAENFNTEAYLAGQYEGIVKQNLPDLDPNKGERKVRMEDGILLPAYQLPTEAEWEYAALALSGNTYDERVVARRLYPWNGHFVRNDGIIDGRETRGQFRANIQRGRGDMMGVAGSLNDNAAITAPVDSYWPNEFGLYCMAGNVNEWVRDVYRPLSFTDVEDFRPFRGNVFQTKERDEEGNIAEKDSLGRIRKRNLTEEECMNRYNFRRSDNINYLDGDLRSSPLKDGTEWTDANEKSGSSRMYYNGKGPRQLNATSLISDRSRVYKGGGWNDRVYWMIPGTRRFLDERQARENIGFRCSMIRVGSATGF